MADVEPRLERADWVRVAVVALLLFLAGLAPHLNIDDLVAWIVRTARRGSTVDKAAVNDVARWLLVAAALCVVRWRWYRRAWRDRGLVVAASLLLLAVYLPHLRFPDLVGWLWGKSVDDADKADAVTAARWILVGGAGVALLNRAFRHVLELSIVLVAALVAVAAAGETSAVVARLDTPSQTATKAAFDRGFSLTADSVAPLAQPLKADHCIRVLVVTGEDPDTSDAKNALVYSTHVYRARLVNGLDAGKPNAAVAVELARAGRAARFAADLAAATTVHLLSTKDAQEAAATTDARSCV